MYELTVQKLKNGYPSKILEAAHLLVLIVLLLFRRKNNDAFLWTKNTSRGVRLLGFNMYQFLAQCEQVYLFFGTCPVNS